MTTNKTEESPHDCRLSRFERNRFYHGKLMTARDMFADQRYHVDRLDTFARHVAGEGIVHGLDVDVTGTETELEVTVQPGVALDCCGQLIVVDDPTDQTVTLDETSTSDIVHLYLEYGECVKETVPLLGSESACKQQCEYNRVLEIFNVVTGDPPYETETGTGEESDTYKRIPRIDFPDPNDIDPNADEREALSQMARSYHENGGTLRKCDPDDRKVFLGSFSFEEQPNGSSEWVEDESVTPGFVYTNDMLYAVIAQHVARHDNPHEVSATDVGALVSVEGVENPGGDVDLTSPDGNVSITPDDGAHAVGLSVPGLDALEAEVDAHVTDTDNPHDVTATQVGALVSVEGVENPGGDVDLTSPDGTVSITTDSGVVGENAIGLTVSGLADLREQHRTDIESITGRLNALETEHDQDVNRLTERLVRIERYVMERSVWCKCGTFAGVVERFGSEIANEIVHRTEEFLNEFGFENRMEPEQYFDFLEEVLELEEELVGELEGSNVGEESLERFRRVVEELRNAFEDRDEEDVLPVAAAQDRVCKAAQCLHRIE